MRRLIGSVALLLGGIGFAACLAVLISVWVLRPTVVRESDHALQAADEGLKVVEAKTKRANELTKKVRESVNPIVDKISMLDDKALRAPERTEAMERFERELKDRLDQLDAIAEIMETGIKLLRQTSRLTKTLRSPTSAADGSADDDAPDRSESLARVAKKIERLREIIARIQDDKERQKKVVDDLVRVTRELNDDLTALDSKLEETHRRAVELRAEIARLRDEIPVWALWLAIIASAVLAWLGLGQFALASWGWRRVFGLTD
jgi:chromosome segregation ATPase